MFLDKEIDIEYFIENKTISNQIEIKLTNKGFEKIFKDYIGNSYYLLTRPNYNVIVYSKNHRRMQLYKNVRFTLLNIDKKYIGFKYNVIDFELISYNKDYISKDKFIDILRK